MGQQLSPSDPQGQAASDGVLKTAVQGGKQAGLACRPAALRPAGSRSQGYFHGLYPGGHLPHKSRMLFPAQVLGRIPEHTFLLGLQIPLPRACN